MSDLSHNIYAVFDPKPLKASHGKIDLYVPLDDIRGDGSIAAILGRKILKSSGPACLALTGHRGSGKSTELARLRADLETPRTSTHGYFVVQVQADDELDRNDIDFPEVLIAIIRQLALQLRTRLSIELKPGLFKNLWLGLKELGGVEIDLDSIELEAGMAKLGANLKYSSETRRKLRKALDSDADSWLKAANDIIGQALLLLQKNGHQGLVIMVDDLDKMIVREHETGKVLTTEFLFVHRAAHLTALQCHLIYTLPIELAYSHHEPSLRRYYGGEIPVVPMAKLRTPPPDCQPYEKGIERFREIIRVRLHSIGAKESDLFESDDVRDDLIRFTGGQPSELMTFIREAIVGSELPITPKAFSRVRAALHRSYDRFLLSEHWPIIEKVRTEGRFPRSLDIEPRIRQLLESRAVLLYQNDVSWYALNPAIESLIDGEGKSSPPPQDQTPKSPCYIHSLRLENLRCYHSEECLDLTGADGMPALWTIILGDNSTGKTTILHCLAALKFAGPRDPSFHAFTAFMHHAVRVREDSGNFFIQYRKVDEDEAMPEFMALKINSDGGYTPDWQLLPPYAVIFAYGVSRRIADGAISEDRESDSCRTLFDENAPLLNAEEWFLQAEFKADKAKDPLSIRRRDTVKALLTGGMLPDVTDLRAAFKTNGTPYAEVETIDGWIPMQHLSSGYRSVISWMTDLASRMLDQYPDSPNPLAEPAIVLVDQIDLFLHPKWQRTLMQDLSTRFPKVQWIVTSHSPLVVQGMPGANLAVVRREDGVSIIDQTLPSIRGWRVDQLLSSELFDETPTRDARTEALLEERESILGKAELSPGDNSRLTSIREELPEISFGPPEENPAIRDLLRRVAAKL